MCPLAARVPPPISEELVQAGAGSARLDGPNLEGLVLFYLKKRISSVDAENIQGGPREVPQILCSTLVSTPPAVPKGDNHLCVLLGGGRV